MQTSWTVSTTTNTELRGKNISKNQSKTVERLRSQAFAVQKRLDLAEQTALILEEMLAQDARIDDAVNNTYEANAYHRLRFQLFRILIVDICAGVLDNKSQTASASSILKDLRKDHSAIGSLKAYYADPTCVEVKVEGENLSIEFIQREKERTRDCFTKESIASIDSQWSRIDSGSKILCGDGAKRILWARNKVIAHFEKSDNGLIALDDDPPYGTGKLTWKEPIEFLKNIRPYVYDIYSLITSMSWGNEFSDVSRFYARAFGDRFKNGFTNLKPGSAVAPARSLK